MRHVPISFFRAVTGLLLIRIYISELFSVTRPPHPEISPKRIDIVALSPDAHELVSGGPARPSRPRLGHKITPHVFDREARGASAHSLSLIQIAPYIFVSPRVLLPTLVQPGHSPVCSRYLTLNIHCSLLPCEIRSVQRAPFLLSSPGSPARLSYASASGEVTLEDNRIPFGPCDA